MNYIFDITLNYNANLINFYEWEEMDNKEFFLKIPIFKIEENTMFDFINSTISVNKDFLNKIYKKSESYKNKDDEFAVLFSSSSVVLGVKFNSEGISISKSYLCIDEEDDVLEFVKSIKYTLIDYKVLERKKINHFITRNELDLKNKLLKELDYILKNNEFDKLKYVYYELYNQVENDNNKITDKIKKLILCNNEKLYKIDSLFNVVKSKIK